MSRSAGPDLFRIGLAARAGNAPREPRQYPVARTTRDSSRLRTLLDGDHLARAENIRGRAFRYRDRGP